MRHSTQHDLAFLHTSHVHVARFDTLVAQLAPHVRVRHEVQPELLARAQALGLSNRELIDDIVAALNTCASSGAQVVVCTCSSIGAIAEALNKEVAFTCQRIDRAMADAAVRAGSRILVVLALASSAAPTRELLQQSALAIGRTVELHTLEVPQAWEHFLREDMHRYNTCIEAAVRPQAQGYDVIVLAQASMQAVAPMLADLAIPVLCSPSAGVTLALAHIRA
jgi:Asp/Glu/hydantoin racemase